MKSKLPRFEGRDVTAAALALSGRARERVGALDAPAYPQAEAYMAGPAPDDAKAELDARARALGPEARAELRLAWLDRFGGHTAPRLLDGPYTVDDALFLAGALERLEPLPAAADDPPPEAYDDDPEAAEPGAPRYDPADGWPQ